MSAREDQGALFGDLDGLFATIELLPVTPVEQVRLAVAPVPAVCADYQPTIAGRWGDRPADDPDNPCTGCHQPRHAHVDNDPGPSGPGSGPFVIVPCSADKLDHAAPAADLYVGQLFRAALKAARALTTDDRIRVLSGRYGLVALDAELAPYDQRIDAAGCVCWATISSQLHALDPDRTVEWVALLPAAYAAALVDPIRPQLTREYVNPLTGSRGIGDIRHRLAEIARTGRLDHDDDDDDPDDDPDEWPTDDPDDFHEIECQCARCLAPSKALTVHDYDREPIGLHESAAEYDARVGPDPRDAEGLGRCVTCAEIVTYETGRSTRWGVLHDGCNEPDHPATDDAPAWTPEAPPTLGELVGEAHAAWKVRACLHADTDTDAAKALRWEGGSGGSRGHLVFDAKGAHLLVLTRTDADEIESTRTLVASWLKLAQAIRTAATADDLAALDLAAQLDRAIDDERDTDPRPWIPAARLKEADQADRFAHERADAAWSKRNEARYQRAALIAAPERAAVQRIAAAIDASSPVALF